MSEKFRRGTRDAKGGTLLVMDAEPQICRLMVRYLKERFEEVVTATDLSDAQTLLNQKVITHILVDPSIFVGPCLPILSQWKRRFQNVKRLVIFTAVNIRELESARMSPAGIDAVVSKSDGIEIIVESLLPGAG